MWQYCEKDYKIYVAGIGTISKKQDDDDGFMFGAGKTGIREKVRKGCEDLAKKLGDIKKDQSKKNSKKKITRITLDVFGFSRGAAAARNFVYEVNVKDAYMPNGYLEHKAKQDYEKRQQENYEKKKKYEQNGGVVAVQDNLKSKPLLFRDAAIKDSDGELVSEGVLKDGMLPKMGHFGYMLRKNGFSLDDINNLEVIIRFVGVYDTVSSYYKEVSMKNFVIDQLTGDPRVNKYFGDDVSELHLKSLGSIHKAVHFTAMNEHRYNFPPTNFPGALEKTFPGVHSDIGGSYPTEPETVDEIEVAFTPSHNLLKLNEQKAVYLLKRGFWGNDAQAKLKNYRENLIDVGWFKEDQIFITDINTFKFRGNNTPLPKSINGGYDKLTGVRDLRKEYSYIPLLFMNAHFKKTLDSNYLKIVPLEKTFNSVFSVDGISVLKKAKDHLKPYVMDNKGVNGTIYLSNILN